MARRALAAVATLAATLPAASALFSTTLHGAPTEVVQPGTPGVATMELQPWLTTVDADVRALYSASAALRSLSSTRCVRPPAPRWARYAGCLRGCLVAANQRAAGLWELRLRLVTSPMFLTCSALSLQAVCNDGTPAGYYYVKGASRLAACANARPCALCASVRMRLPFGAFRSR